ncbi:hypothetical protein GQR60_06530 [Labilibaculum sp. A4]|uniref:hypothetical protein n=1 Tax=Labilibaculum euxinus TaxID=2686357 RepID=UPI000F61A2DB|nr:hypothetical protein [Labilibaculum euxinus]MWN75986.1 hypothetical protein [Labilibaculum euxinus]
MNTKKIFGYIFIVISIILSIAIIGQLPSFVSSITNLSNIFNKNIDSEKFGNIIGAFMYWVIHITLIIILWKYGRKWTKKRS